MVCVRKDGSSFVTEIDDKKDNIAVSAEKFENFGTLLFTWTSRTYVEF